MCPFCGHLVSDDTVLLDHCISAHCTPKLAETLVIGGAEGDLNEVNALLDKALSSVSVKYSRVYLEKGQYRLKVKLVGGKEVNKYFKENEFEWTMTFVQSQALIKWLKS